MAARKTNYQILGVSENASAADIKRAYKKLAMKYHPDRNTDADKDAAEEKFKEINNAYQALTGKNTFWNWSSEDDEYSYKAADLTDAFNRAAQSFYAYKRTVENFDSLYEDACSEGSRKKGFFKSLFFGASIGEKHAIRALKDIKRHSVIAIILGEVELQGIEMLVSCVGLDVDLMSHIDQFTYGYERQNADIKDCLEVIRGNKQTANSFRP